MMKKFAISLIVMMAIAQTSFGVLNWAWSGASGMQDDGVSAGWLVRMYYDVNNDSTLGSVTFDNTGAATGAGNSADDVFMTAGEDYSTATVSGFGEVQFQKSFSDGWEANYGGATVYTVVFNAADASSASQTAVADSSTYTLPSVANGAYGVGGINNSWTAVVPEPTTIAFLGVGLVAFVLRKKIRS